jgi:3-oxoacyl-(acyl-carrier-protein) synthase
VDAAAAVLSVQHDKIPPSVNTRKPRDGIKLNVSQESRDATINVAVSSVFSLGGQNAALVFRKA